MFFTFLSLLLILLNIRLLLFKIHPLEPVQVPKLSTFLNFSLIQHKYHATVHDCLGPVSDGDGCSLLGDLVQCPLNQTLVFTVKRRSGLVKQKNFRVSQ